MSGLQIKPPTRNRIVLLGCLVVVPVGLKLGYDFGMQISGPLLGLAAAVNTGALAALLIDSLADLLLQRSHDAPRQG